MNAPKPLITGTDFVFVPTRNFAAAEEFYGTVLGLRCSARYSNGFGGEFETGSLTILLLESEKIGREFKPSSGAIALRVDDVEAARSELASRGVSFSGDTIDSGVCYQAFFSDPDGNALILHHRYALATPDGLEGATVADVSGARRAVQPWSSASRRSRKRRSASE